MKALSTFLFAKRETSAFVFFRISTATLCLMYYVTIYSEINNLFGLDGFIGREITEATISSPYSPTLGWIINPLIESGWSDSSALSFTMCLFCGFASLMLIGLFTKISVAVVWIIHIMIYNSNHFFSYGVDNFISISLFYCLFMPLNKQFSIDRIIFKKRSFSPDLRMNNFFVRIMQIQMMIAYFFSGLEKFFSPFWWNGDSIWRALMRPPFISIDFSFLAQYPFIAKVLGIVTILLELLFPVMMWIKRVNKIWFISILCMHLGIAIFMNLWLFSSVMIALNIVAFGWDLFFQKWHWRFDIS